MNIHQEEIADLIFRSLTGEATPQDNAKLKRWISDSLENERHFNRLKNLWTSSEAVGNMSRYDAEAAFEKFSERVMADGGFSQDDTNAAEEMISTDGDVLPKHKSWLYMPVWMRWAAVILIIAGCCWQFYEHGQQSVERQLAQICVEAPAGSQTITTLPDGTRITLNAGSRIIYSQSFGIKDRNVALTGEGYFEVAHNGDKPFTVTTASISVRDIGTKFSLADYPNDNEAQVVLTDGSVELDNKLCSDCSNVVMKKGQRAVLSKESGKLVVGSGDGATEYSAGIAYEKLYDNTNGLQITGENYALALSYTGKDENDRPNLADAMNDWHADYDYEEFYFTLNARRPKN